MQLKTHHILSLVLCSLLAPELLNGKSYPNPVLWGDYPDPSVIRVGDEYWATATTSEWAPIFPLLRSRNLLEWEMVGAVFQKRPSWSVGNYWAPEIAEHKGKFFVYYVARITNGPLSIAVATAPKPQGPWTDHGPMVSQAAGSIDPVTALDEQGQLFMIWKEDCNSRNLPTPLWIQKLSEDGTKLIGERREIMRNDAPWEKNLIEGPYVQKKGDYYYLFYSGNACCGRNCDYALGVARAKNLLGPWEKNPANPILAGNDLWKCPGHGTIVTTPDGKDMLLYHAYAADDFVYVGRQGLLDEVVWGANGWPTINEGKGPSQGSRLAGGNVLEFSDDFSSPELKPDWQWPQNMEPRYQLKKTNGRVALSPTAGRTSDIVGGVLAVKTLTADYEATTALDRASLPSGATAGLSAFGDRENALGIAVKDGQALAWRRQRNKHETVATAALGEGKTVQFRMQAMGGHKFQFAFSENGADWKTIGDGMDVEGKHLPPWDRGVRVALTSGGSDNAAAEFDWIKIRYTDK